MHHADVMQHVGWSTVYPDDEEVQGAMQIFLANSLSTLKGIDSSFLTSAGQLLQSAAPQWLSHRVERYGNRQRHGALMQLLACCCGVQSQ